MNEKQAKFVRWCGQCTLKKEEKNILDFTIVFFCRGKVTVSWDAIKQNLLIQFLYRFHSRQQYFFYIQAFANIPNAIRPKVVSFFSPAAIGALGEINSTNKRSISSAFIHWSSYKTLHRFMSHEE